MPELSADDREKLLALDDKARAKRAAQKLAKSIPLTAAERRALAGSESESDYVASWDELADACSIDRRTLTNARQAHALLIKQRKPQLARADGRHCIAEWQRLLAEVGVQGRGLNDSESTLLDERGLKLRKMKVDVERAEWEFEKTKDEHLPVSQFQSALRVMLTAFHASLNAFAGRVNPRLEGLDYDARSEVLEDELNILRRTLAQCDYLGGAEVLPVHPPDPPLTEPSPVCPPKKPRKKKRPASSKKPARSSSRSSAPSSRRRRK